MWQTTIICLPFAGAGPLFFRPWREFAGPDLEIYAPPMSGRERLVDQPLPDTVQEIADEILPAAVDHVGSGPVVLFGHCFGALLAYELAQRLSCVPSISVLRLFASGAAGPWAPREQRVAGLSDEQLIELVEELAGYRHPALRHPEMRSLIVPVLRADLEMTERYEPASAAGLDVPITVLRGSDDHFVGRADVAGWVRATTGDFQSIELWGDHMYIVDSARPVLDLVRAAVARNVRS